MFCTWRRTKLRQPIIKADHSSTLETASSNPQRGVILQREINRSERRARERTQCLAVLFARLFVSRGCHVPDDGTPWLAIQRMSLLFCATKCLNYRENCFGICWAGKKKTILFGTTWELSGSQRKIFPCLCCHHKQEAGTRQRTVSLKLKGPHQSLPSLAKGVIYHSSASNYSPLPFHL